MMKSSRFLLTLCLISLMANGQALADRNDGTKPMNFSAQSANMDDLRKTYHYVGSVRMTQGSRLLTSDKVSIKQDAAGFTKSIAYGSAQKPAHVKQRENDGKGWMEGWGERIEYDDRTDKFIFFDQAHIKTSTDDAKGDVIIYDNVTERYQILAKGQPIPDINKALPAQAGVAPHPPKPSGWTPAPSKATLPTDSVPPVSTTPDGRAKAVITPGK
jgi:lipopolysaccharide export system protein LptA